MNISIKRQLGFTLLELMVVIVIIGILASLILLNTEGVGQRKAFQAREGLMLDLNKIKKESLDQAKILALVTAPATDLKPFSYEIAHYQNQTSSTILQANQKWQPEPEFLVQTLPERVTFTIESTDNNPQSTARQALLNQQAPKLIWFGNGEVTPVRIQFYYEQRPVGYPIEIDHLGKVTHEND